MRRLALTTGSVVAIMALLFVGAVEARMHAGPNVLTAGHRLKSTGGALDGSVSTSVAAGYSFRLLRQAYLGTGAAVRLRRASDNAESDFGFAGNGDWDGASAAAFCNATSCFVRTWYDQSGNARHAQQATAGSQPALVFNCIGLLPCIQAAAGKSLASANITPVAPWSINTVARMVTRAGPNNCFWGSPTIANTFVPHATADSIVMYNGSVQTGDPSPGGATPTLLWHSYVGVFSTTAWFDVDTYEIGGNLPPSVAAQALGFSAGTGEVCNVAEQLTWSAYALTVSERANLVANQRAYWMPPYALDAFGPQAVAYSFRRLRSGYTVNKAVQLRRASDNAVQDIGFSGLSDFDVAAATTFCASTSCSLAKWYDQSGNGRDAVQATAASQPALVFNCQGTLPCARGTTVNQILQSGSVAWAANMTSASVVAKRGSGTGQCFFIAKNNPGWFAPNAAANQWILFDQISQQIAATAADGAWHAGAGAINGAASVARIDGTETTGTVTGSAVAGPVSILYMNGSTTVCDEGEAIIWDNYALTAAERANLVANQRAYWGF